MRLKTYVVTGIDVSGNPFALTQEFKQVQAGEIGAVVYDDGVLLKDARALLSRWNSIARAQGNKLVYGFSGEQLEAIAAEQRVIIEESYRLREEVKAFCTGPATLKLRLGRIDDMSDEQLLASARRRALVSEDESARRVERQAG